jgi:hypothetical protein
LIGNAWNEWTGSFRTQNNTAVGQAAVNVATVYTTAMTDSAQSMDIVSIPAGGYAGFVSRYSITSDAFYRAGVTATYNSVTKATTYTANIYRKLAGVWTLLASARVGAGTGNLSFVTMGHSQQLFFNGVLVAASSDSALRAGVDGIYTTVGVALDNYAVATPLLTTPGLTYSQIFGASSDPGTNWYANFGGFATVNGQLVGVGAVNEMTLYGDRQLNASLQLQVSALAASGSAGLLARYDTTTGNTYWAGLVSSYNATTKVTTYTAQVRRRVAGVWTVLFTKSVATPTGALDFEVNGNLLSLSLNGASLGAVRDNVLSAAGTVGISGSKNSQFASFSAS